MTVKKVLTLTTALFLLCYGKAIARDATPEQVAPVDSATAGQPIGRGRPVTTTTIKRCPDRYELVTRANGQRGCATDILPTNE
jgi:hypothetical protein